LGGGVLRVRRQRRRGRLRRLGRRQCRRPEHQVGQPHRPPEHHFSSTPISLAFSSSTFPALATAYWKLVMAVQAAPTRPLASRARSATLAGWTPRRTASWLTRLAASSHASCAPLPARIASTTSRLPPARMISSPTPVAPAAPAELSTYSPGPISGESPT